METLRCLWSPHGFYSPGHIVMHESTPYIALKPNQRHIPGVSDSWEIYDSSKVYEEFTEPFEPQPEVETVTVYYPFTTMRGQPLCFTGETIPDVIDPNKSFQVVDWADASRSNFAGLCAETTLTKRWGKLATAGIVVNDSDHYWQQIVGSPYLIPGAVYYLCDKIGELRTEPNDFPVGRALSYVAMEVIQ